VCWQRVVRIRRSDVVYAALSQQTHSTTQQAGSHLLHTAVVLVNAGSASGPISTCCLILLMHCRWRQPVSLYTVMHRQPLC
jgi:hypothetical protein